MRRIGIFGGTFNPPHNGHVSAAKAFFEKMKLDELIIIPAFMPPHKDLDTSVTCDNRFAMCRLAFKDIPNTRVSDIEISRGGRSYTYLTLQALTNTDCELYFLCGTDMILTLDSWKNPDVIFSLASICYIRREADDLTTELIEKKCREYSEIFNARVFAIDADVIEISSSEIRGNLSDMTRYLSDDVVDYIRKEGLYE